MRDRVERIDAEQRIAVLACGPRLPYDKLVLSPGVELMWDGVAGLRAANEQGRILQAWKAGAETTTLRRQLEAMRDGGTFAITIPEAPYRCPPGPYERACQVAHYLKTAKPRSKVLVLDANPDVTSKGALFKRVWSERYPGIVEYRPQHKATAVDAAAGIVRFEVQDDVRADVLNVLPPMRAGAVAVQSGLANCERALVPGQLPELRIDRDAACPRARRRDPDRAGDAEERPHGERPRQGGRRGDRRRASGRDIDPAPMLTNTCYSFVDDQRAIHVASVHEYVAAERTFKTVAGSGGLSSRGRTSSRVVWTELGPKRSGPTRSADRSRLPALMNAKAPIDALVSETDDADTPAAEEENRVLLQMPVDIRSASLALLAVLGSLYTLYWAKAVFVPILLGLMASYALTPVVDRFERWHVPRVLGAAAVLLSAIVTAVTWMGYHLRNDASALIESLPEVAQRFREAAVQDQPGQRAKPATAIEKVQQAASELEKTAETPPRARRREPRRDKVADREAQVQHPGLLLDRHARASSR